MRNLLILMCLVLVGSIAFPAKKILVDEITFGASPESTIDKQITFGASDTKGALSFDYSTQKMQISNNASDYLNITDNFVINSNIGDLLDVDTTGASQNDCLRLDGATWTATSGCGAGGGAGATELNDLSDVLITTPATGQVLTYDGSIWENDTPSSSGGMTCETITADTTMTINTCYVVNQTSTASKIALILPTTMATGSRFAVVGSGDSGWELYTNSGASGQDLKYKGSTTETSSLSTVLLASSTEFYGESDFITMIGNQTVVPKAVFDVEFQIGIAYFAGVSSHWKMDEASGSLADSRGTTTTDLSRIGSPVQTTGFIDFAQQTFSSSNYFRAFNSSYNNTGGANTRFSFSCWTKFTTGSVQKLFSNTTSGYAEVVGNFILEMDSGNNFQIREPGTTANTTNVSTYADGEWHYITAIVDSGAAGNDKKIVYIDGARVDNQDGQNANTFTAADGYLTLGAVAGGSGWSNPIDEAEYWHGSVMTLEQHQERYNEGLGVRYY